MFLYNINKIQLPYWMQGLWSQLSMFDRLPEKQYGKSHIWREIMNKTFRKHKFKIRLLFTFFFSVKVFSALGTAYVSEGLKSQSVPLSLHFYLMILCSTKCQFPNLDIYWLHTFYYHLKLFLIFKASVHAILKI